MCSGPNRTEREATPCLGHFEIHSLDQDRDRAHDGAGIGLAICKALVEARNGTIPVEPASPIGAGFVVELPFAG